MPAPPSQGADGGSPLQAIEAKAFVPARDFDLSLRFYRALGFVVAWSEGGLAELRHGAAAFLLQDFHVDAHAANFQMHLLVESADAWHRRFETHGIAEAFGVRPEPPADRPWGIRDFSFVDPGGVMWRVGHALAPRRR